MKNIFSIIACILKTKKYLILMAAFFMAQRFP